MTNDRDAISLQTPLSAEDVSSLRVGDTIFITGQILAGRDAVLPKICDLVSSGEEKTLGVSLEGAAIFHTAVSPAGVGPTSSNKLEIEESIVPLSKAGVRMHIGKGRISEGTIKGMCDAGSCFAVIPPVTALLGSKTKSQRTVAFSELGMEALHELDVEGYPVVIAAVNGESIFG